MKQLIYIAEDEENIRELLRCTLESYGYEVQAFGDGAALLDMLRTMLPSLVLLDIMMPGKDGYAVLREIKASPKTKDIPVILITAKGSEVDKVIGLDMGADDYIAKPFGLLELTARVRAALRRGADTHRIETVSVLRVSDVVLSLDTREVYRSDELVELTYKEFELLRLLMQNPGRVLSREELLNEIWGYDYLGETRTLDMHIKTLREKLRDDAQSPRYIKTTRGVGYKIMATE